MVYTERYKEAIDHMCWLKYLIRYSESHVAEHIFSMAAECTVLGIAQMLDSEFYESLQNICTEEHICYIFQ